MRLSLETTPAQSKDEWNTSYGELSVKKKKFDISSGKRPGNEGKAENVSRPKIFDQGKNGTFQKVFGIH